MLYEVGYDQVSSNDQQPFVRKHNAAGTQLWYHRHDTTNADMKAVAVALDAQSRPYVLFSVDGGGTVSIITRLNPENGQIVHGTFLRARLTNGNTNTFRPTGLAVVGDTVLVDAASAYWAPGAGATQGNWQQYSTDGATGNGRFRVGLPLDLSALSSVTRLGDND